MNGTETGDTGVWGEAKFYSSVILNGTETVNAGGVLGTQFYSSVILNGTETDGNLDCNEF